MSFCFSTMLRRTWAHLCFVSCLLVPWGTAIAAAQEVVPDGTIPTQVLLDPNTNGFVVRGGAIHGANLFHSFESFSPGAQSVLFDLQVGGFEAIERIFSRVTGSEASYVDGLLQTVGGNQPDLFLFNPNGLLFGANAKLDLGGSFIGSTADAVNFADGSRFSAIAPDASSLLSLSIPVGLQLGSNPGSITVEGIGHALTADISNPIIPSPLKVSSTDYGKGLSVAPNSTIALVGNGIRLVGGTLQSQSLANVASIGGVQLTLGSGGLGEVALASEADFGWELDYQGLGFLSDIDLESRSRIDGSGAAPSTLRLHGQNITLADSSAIFSNYSGAPGTTNGKIDLYAGGQLKLEGSFVLDESQIPSQIRNITVSSGNGGALEIVADSILIRDGARLSADTFSVPGSPVVSSGNSGPVKLRVAGEIQLSATPDAPLISPIPSLISSSSFSSNGNGGLLDIEAGQLRIIDGSILSSVTIGGVGNGSDIQIKAQDSVYVEGSNASNGFVSGISSSSFGQGDAGNILIDSPKLKAVNGGYVEASVYAAGTAGNIIIDASESIDVGGFSRRGNFLGGARRASFIGSLVSIPSGVVDLFGLPPVPTGETGKVVVDTPRLRLFDSGIITVVNDGLGDAGQLEISATEISLNQASILAETAQGNGGNIKISDAETLLLRNGSTISASAEGGGNGGNIEIAAESIVAISQENSDISANAVNSEGGRVSIAASSILGAQVRERQTALSDITASSELGPQFSGVVELVQPNVQPDSVAVTLPKALVDQSDRLAQSCSANDSQFRVAGRGGLPWSPLDLPELSFSETDLALAKHNQGKSGQSSHSLSLQLLEAISLREQGFYPRALVQLEGLVQAKSLLTSPGLHSQVLQQLGITYRLLGQQVEARAALEKSFAIATQASAELAETPSLSQARAAASLSLGHLAKTQNDLRQARQHYFQALEMSGDSEVKGLALASLMSLEIEQENGAAADKWRQQLFVQTKRQPASEAIVAGQLHSIAVQLKAIQASEQLSSGQLKHMGDELEHLLAWAQQVDDPQAIAYSLGYLGQVEELAENWELAQQYSAAALQFSQTNGDELMAYQWAWQLGRIARYRWNQTGDTAWYEQSQVAYQLALESLQSLRSDLLTVAPALQLSFRSGIEPVYREYVDLLLEQPDSMAPVRQLEQWQEAINTAEALRLAELDNYLQDACLTARPRSVAEIDGGAAVIYPIVLRDRLEVIVTLPQGEMRRYSQPVGQVDLEKTVKAFRDGLVWRSQRDFAEPGQQLYQWLIQPVVKELTAEAVETLVIVPDGVLKNVPLAAISDGQEYLIEKFAIVTAPGIELLPSQQEANSKVQTLVAGITQRQQGLAALPFVSQELRDVQAAIPGQMLLDEQFTRQMFADALADYDASIVHIATHGQFGSQASDTYIQAWNEQISLTQLGDILQARSREGLSPTELLVLSACETAVGDEAAALGLAGVAVRAGARSTLASLWSVNDQSTAALMAEFYQQLAKTDMGKAEALRQTQLEMLKDPVYRHPYYWAAFTLLGDWQ